MATIIQIKRTTTANLPSTLEQGELAYLYDSSSTDTDAGGNGGRLFIGDPTTNTNTPIKIGGEYYTDMMDHVQGTLTASAALLVDSNKKINEFFVDNLKLDGNAITSTDTDGNITITPNGTGKTIISNIYTDATTTLQEYIEDVTGGQLVAGEGIDIVYDDNAGSSTISGEDASTTNKGIASFDSNHFDVTSGAVTVKAGSIENGDLAGSIANAKLSNSTISVAADSGTTNAVDLGDTLTIGGGTGLTSTVSGDAVSIALDNTAVTAGSYGSSTAIPTFTVDAQGRLTAAGTASITTTLTVAADSGSGDGVALADDTLTFTGGEGIDTSVSGDTITIAAELATDTNKGVASFSSNDFAVSSGAVTIKSGGVSNDQLAGSIANAKLSNSAITIGSDSVSLGATQTDLNGLTSVDVDNLTLDGNTISSTNTDGDINLTPNGEGVVIVPSDYTGRTNWGAQALVPKSYVDQVANGLDVKASVRVATTANLAATYNNANGTLTATSNGAIAIDGVTLDANDRVLVKDQTDAVENGFYKVTTTGGASAAFVLTRTPDANEASEITGGAFTFVEEGTNNADNGYVATHNGTPTLGTDDITFEQFSGAGQISAGDGLSKTGNTLDVNVDDSSIEISGDSLQVKALGITNAMLAGSIANAKLTNSSITINSQSISLGGSHTFSTTDIGEGTNLYYTDERVDDRINALFVAGEGIDFTYDDANGTFTVDAELATASNKGVASFSSANFLVSSGAVTITGVDGGTF